MNKVAARAKNREKKKLNDNFSDTIWPVSNFVGMLPRLLSTKITKMVLFQWSRWLPEQKKESSLNDNLLNFFGQL